MLFRHVSSGRFSAMRTLTTSTAVPHLTSKASRSLYSFSWLRSAPTSTGSPAPSGSKVTSTTPTLASRAKGPSADSGLESAAELQAAMAVAQNEVDKNTVLTSVNGETSSPAASHKNASNTSPVADPTQPETSYLMPHPHWQEQYVKEVFYTHRPPVDNLDKMALYTIRAIRFNFDWMSGYVFGRITPRKALTRIMFLETVAGVPGSIGGILRHLASLRRMKRDGGWINTLFEEAENERMHLLTALQLRQPGRFMRTCVFFTQGIFFNFFWIAYLISPRFCHRLVGYLEEEAVVTYTKILHEIDKKDGSLAEWRNLPAPKIAIAYWALPESATFRDVLAHIRADEAHHRDVNHQLASLKADQINPFRYQR